MADLTAAEGSFEWAMLELKNGKRVSREAWKDRSMYLVLNPGEPGQTVKDGDWRALAGVPVDTKFDYLPNIEICNAEGNFVPYQPSQVDMKSNDWISPNKQEDIYTLTLDIISGKNSAGYGFIANESIINDSCDIIYTNTPCTSIYQFTDTDPAIPIDSTVWFASYVADNTTDIDKMRWLFKNYNLSISVDNNTYEFGTAALGTMNAEEGLVFAVTYTGEVSNKFLNELNQTEIKRRYYFKWIKA